MAIVVMKQPVTKAEIDNIRDADSEKVMRTLIKGELIREVCRLREPGSPAMYGITDNCLHRFGVKKYEGEIVKSGNIIIKQRGSVFHPGKNTYAAKDYSIHAKKEGVVKFRRMSGFKRGQYYVDVVESV